MIYNICFVFNGSQTQEREPKDKDNEGEGEVNTQRAVPQGSGKTMADEENKHVSKQLINSLQVVAV